MDIAALHIVRRVAEQGGFSAAARALDLDPSTVSRTVAQVEAALGARLFQRSTRRLTVTEAGARWLRRAGPALEELEAAGEDARGDAATPRGPVRISASVAFGSDALTPLLADFRTALPDITLDLRLSDANVDLIAEQVDLAIRLAPAPSGDLISTRLCATRYRVVAAPDYAGGPDAPRRPADLARCDCLLMDLPGYRDRWIFRRDGAVSDVAVSGSIRISSPLALRRAAAAGLGLALLADWLTAEDRAAGRLVDLFPDHDVTATTFDTAAWALYPARAFLPARTRATLDFLRRAFTAPAGGAADCR